MTDIVLQLHNINKIYNEGLPSQANVLHNISLDITRGEMVAIIGPSGSGKSTLLNIIGLLDRPSSGDLFINNQKTAALNDKDLTHLRGHSIGFVFQYHYLISAFTAAENIMIPLWADVGFESDHAKKRAAELLERVGLTLFADKKANHLSGGQQQRVAIARALAMNPDILLADEPTGNLDSENAESIFELLRDLNRKNKMTILLVTHNLELANKCDRIIRVIDGTIQSS